MKAIFRLPFEEKFILIHHHEAARNVASFFPFRPGCRTADGPCAAG